MLSNGLFQCTIAFLIFRMQDALCIMKLILQFPTKSAEKANAWCLHGLLRIAEREKSTRLGF